MSSSAHLPDPPVPANVVLRDFHYMPLDVARLRDSGLASQATGEEFRAAVLLWCASWHQTPAGSLPSDEKILANLAGFGRSVRDWRKVSAMALHGWTQCSDGRLYHRVVAEKALEAWRERLRNRWRTECGRIKKSAQRTDSQPKYPAFEEWMARFEATGETQWPSGDVPVYAKRVSPGTRRGRPRDVPGKIPLKGREAKRSEAKGREGKGKPIDDSTKLSNPDNERSDAWLGAMAGLARVLRDMGWGDCADGHPELRRAAQAGVDPRLLQAAAAGRGGKPVAYVVQRAIGMLQDAAGPHSAAPSPPPPPAPELVEARAALTELDDRLIALRHDHQVLGLIDEPTFRERAAALEAARRELTAHLEQLQGGLH